MQLRRLISPHIPLAVSLLAAAGCVPPTPDYCSVREGHAEYDQCRLDNNVDLPEHPLSLQEIIDIAICRNLDVQVQRMEELAQCERVFAQKLRELPDLDVNGEFTNRNNDPAWFSRTVNPGGSRKADPGPIGNLASQSTSKFHRSMDAAVAISVIDFGLSFVRARQEKNRLCLLKQRNMRARQNLVLDIYRAYYRAMVAKQAIEEARDLISDLQERQQTLAEQIQRQIVSEMKGLVNENRLIDMQVKLYAFENEYRSAITELSGLMGVPPGQVYELAPIDVYDIEVGEFDMRDLENVALRYRPELMAQDMQYYVDSDEVRAAIIQMFPNARLFAGLYHQDDIFMYNSDWYKFGTNLSWNLLELPSQWKQKDVAEYRKKIAWETRLSMSMGILTQVHLAHINVRESALQYNMSKDLFKVKNRQLRVAKVLESSGEMSSDDVMVFDVETLFARVNAIKAYANLQIALEQLSNALGRPLLLSGIPDGERPYGLEQCCNFAGLSGIEIGNVQRVPTTLLNDNNAEQIGDNRANSPETRDALHRERRRLDPSSPNFDSLTGRPYMDTQPRRGSSYYKNFLRNLRDEEQKIADRTLYDQQQNERSQSFFYGESPGEEGGRYPQEEDEMPQEEYDPPGRQGGLGRGGASNRGGDVAETVYYEDYLKSTNGSTDGFIEEVDVEETAPSTDESKEEVSDRDGPNLYEQQQYRRRRSPSATRDSSSLQRDVPRQVHHRRSIPQQNPGQRRNIEPLNDAGN